MTPPNDTGFKDDRTGWFWLHDRIYDTYLPVIGHMAMLVYIALARHANKAGESWAAKSTLAKELKMSERTVDTAIAILAKYRLILITRRPGDKARWETNIYTIIDPPKYIVTAPTKSLDQLATEAAEEAENQPIPTPAPSSSPSVCSPSGCCPLDAPAAPIWGRVLPPKGANDDTMGAVGAPLIQQKDGSQLPVPPEFPSLTASTASENPWEQLKGFMRPQLPRTTYETWLRDTTLLTATENEYTIRVHDAHTREWLSKRLQSKIAVSLQNITGRHITVKYVTAQEIPQ